MTDHGSTPEQRPCIGCGAPSGGLHKPWCMTLYAGRVLGHRPTPEQDVRRPPSGTEGELREALEVLAAWQPYGKLALEALHPQHREAVEAARALLQGDKQ